MNELQVKDGMAKRHLVSMETITFNFFGKTVRGVALERKPWFVGKDIAIVLGYQNPTKAMNDHCRGVTKRYPIVDSLGRIQNVRIINEPNVYRLINHSKLPEAEQFEAWAYEEVLPRILKTGKYSTAETRLEALEAKVELLLEEKSARENLDRCERSKKRVTPKDLEEIRELYKANCTKADIKRITYWGLTVINRALREEESQPGLFEDEPSESFGEPLEALRGHDGGAA
jgi:prophage antirepressor-like protein